MQGPQDIVAILRSRLGKQHQKQRSLFCEKSGVKSRSLLFDISPRMCHYDGSTFAISCSFMGFVEVANYFDTTTEEIDLSEARYDSG